MTVWQCWMRQKQQIGSADDSYFTAAAHLTSRSFSSGIGEFLVGRLIVVSTSAAKQKRKTQVRAEIAAAPVPPRNPVKRKWKEHLGKQTVRSSQVAQHLRSKHSLAVSGDKSAWASSPKCHMDGQLLGKLLPIKSCYWTRCVHIWFDLCNAQDDRGLDLTAGLHPDKVFAACKKWNRGYYLANHWCQTHTS